MEHDELIQVLERALHDAEQAFRTDPSDAARRRVMNAWAELREARGEPSDDGYPLPITRPSAQRG